MKKLRHSPADDPRYGERAGAEIESVDHGSHHWGFRLMITFGGIAALAAAIGRSLVERAPYRTTRR